MSQNQPPATSYAILDTRNSILILNFSPAGTTSAVFAGILPENISFSSGLTVRLHWVAATATTAACVWQVEFEKMTTDLDTDSWGTATGTTPAGATTNATSGIITTTEIACATGAIDSLAAGDNFRLRVSRLGADAADTMAGNASLVLVEVRAT
jgi:hypothetical protein